MEKSTALVDPLRRRWYRLHLSTWLILPLGLLVTVLVVLPGARGRYPERESWFTDDEPAAIVHGWPLPFLWRTPDGWRHYNYMNDMPALSLFPWALTDSVREFRLLPLLADTAIALAGLAVLAALVEWRRRRIRRLLQFSVREFLIATALVGTLVGWWCRERAADRDEKERLESLGDVLEEEGEVPRAPLWLEALLGDENLSRIGLDMQDREFAVNGNSLEQPDAQYVVEHYPDHATVQFYESVSANGAKAAAARGKLRQIRCADSEPADLTRLLTALKEHPHLRSAELGVEPGDPGGDGVQIGDEQARLIATLPRLESLTIRQTNGVNLSDRWKTALDEQGISELRKCKRLEVLSVPDTTLSASAIDSLAGITHLRRLDIASSRFSGASLEPLCRLSHLEDLRLAWTDINDAGALQLRGMPALRCLDLAFTSVSNSAVKRLLDPAEGHFGENLEQICLGPSAIDDDLIAIFKRLPRLHFVVVAWDGTPAKRADGTSRWDKIMAQLQRELPDRDVIRWEMFPRGIIESLGLPSRQPVQP